MARFCTNCGTEVDQSALFCPTCGQPMDATAEIQVAPPPPPTWPEPEPQVERAADPAEAEQEAPDEPELRAPPTAPPPAAPPLLTAPPPPPAPPPIATAYAYPAARPLARDELAVPNDRAPSDAPAGPIAWPTTLAGWLTGVGALLASLGLLVGLVVVGLGALDLVLLALMLAIAASVFLASTLPAIPGLQLGRLVIALLATGIALERVGAGLGGAVGLATLLLFVGSGAVAIGGILLEAGQDRPLGVTEPLDSVLR